MKKLNKDIQEKTIAELGKQAMQLREEIGKLTIEHKVKPQKDTNFIFKKRKELARVLNVLNEKKGLEIIENVK